MAEGMVISLINNLALLLALGIIYEVSYSLPARLRMVADVLKGLLIGLICLAIMLVPFHFTSGLVFDTRSILLSISAYVFGPLPAIIAGLIAISYRIFMGGIGMLTGVTVVILSVGLGLLWRKIGDRLFPKRIWLRVYVLGLLVHIAMLGAMFLMPFNTAIVVVQAIRFPVLLIYPIGSVFLAVLLLHQRDRHEAMSLVAAAENRYRSLFEGSKTIKMLVDPDSGRILDANPGAVDYYGWTIEQLRGMLVSDLNTMSLAEIKKEMELAVTEQRNYFQFQHRKADGTIVDVEIYSDPIEIDSKTILYSTIHDITQRVAVERELLDSEQRFRLLIDSAPASIFIQVDSRFEFVNRFTAEMLGAKSPRDLIGTSVLDRFHPDDREAVGKRISLLNDRKLGVPLRTETLLRLDDGAPISVDVSAVPIQYKGKHGALVFAQDVTERVKMEQARSEMDAQQRQRQKMEAIGTLAGGVAHEINNPISGIMNYAQLILDQGQDGSNQSVYAREILQETDRIALIVRNLLQFSRQEKQSHSYASPYDIVEQTVSLIRTIIKKDQIDLEIEMEEDLPDLKCRSQQIQQVIMNLLTNARDALNEKYSAFDTNKKIRLLVQQHTMQDRRWIRFVVEDLGIGIPAAIRDKIFEPFFSTKPKALGTGLGLSISFGIVHDHHGTLAIDSKEGEYTRMILDLPVDNGWNLE